MRAALLLALALFGLSAVPVAPAAAIVEPPAPPGCDCVKGVAAGIAVYTETSSDPFLYAGNCRSQALVVTQVVGDHLSFEVVGTSGSLCDVDMFFDHWCEVASDGTLVCIDDDDDDGFVDFATLTVGGVFQFRGGDGAGSYTQALDGQLVRLF